MVGALTCRATASARANWSRTLVCTVPRRLLVLSSWCVVKSSVMVAYETPGNREAAARNGDRGTCDWIGPSRWKRSRTAVASRPAISGN